MQRVIFHIDVNSAFLSWSAVRLMQNGQSDIRLVPSVVAGDPSDRRSIITAASMPAKRLGIQTAQPVQQALRVCPELVIVRADWEWYKHCSRGFMAICRAYSTVLQQFSIDECFIDMSEPCATSAPVMLATQLKDEVHQRLGFTVNVGIGPNKLLAKMASDFEKPNRVHTLWADEVPGKMWPLGVRSLLWVGPKTEQQLVAQGTGTIGELACTPVEVLARAVGQRQAVLLHAYANGLDDSPVRTTPRVPKSYSAERTFPRDLVAPGDIDRALFRVACVVAHRIRRDGVSASTVSIFIKHSDFTVMRRQCQLQQPTSVTALILNAARHLLGSIWDGATPLRQVGLGVAKLSPTAEEPPSLFADPQLGYYREWDRRYDARAHRPEDARLMAYDRTAEDDEYAPNGL
ncbi:MAG: DNA polymerase IV [Bacteroidales bacterium]|nr:DNA polymerase IV [Bacteroidales bacterium]